MIERSTVAEVYFDGDVTQTSNGYTNIEISGHNAEADKLLIDCNEVCSAVKTAVLPVSVIVVKCGILEDTGAYFGHCFGQNGFFKRSTVAECI